MSRSSYTGLEPIILYPSQVAMFEAEGWVRGRDLVIYNGSISRVDMYDTVIEHDDYNDCVRVRVRPKAT